MKQTHRASSERTGPERSGNRANAQQVRDDVDAGRARDKVDHPDPATAPLGTDAEAGGARAWDQSGSTGRGLAEHEAPARDRFGAPRAHTARPWVIALVVAIILNACLVWWFAAP